MKTENQCEGVKILCLCSLLLDSVCGYVVCSCEPFGKQASKQHRGLQVQALNAGRGDTQVYCIVRGFACGSGIP